MRDETAEWLLAAKRMFSDLCECNEHRKTEGFEVSVYAESKRNEHRKTGGFEVSVYAK